jgi:hypothetical protein
MSISCAKYRQFNHRPVIIGDNIYIFSYDNQ